MLTDSLGAKNLHTGVGLGQTPVRPLRQLERRKLLSSKLKAFLKIRIVTAYIYKQASIKTNTL